MKPTHQIAALFLLAFLFLVLVACRSSQASQPHAILDGDYRVYWDREGKENGVVSLDSARGLYHWRGNAPGANQRSFHFVDAPQGHYTVQFKPNAVGKTLAELPDGATIAVVNFDPDHVKFDSTNARALVEIRMDQKRHTLFMHSVVSEFETWKITRDPTP